MARTEVNDFPSCTLRWSLSLESQEMSGQRQRAIGACLVSLVMVRQRIVQRDWVRARIANLREGLRSSLYSLRCSSAPVEEGARVAPRLARQVLSLLFAMLVDLLTNKISG